MNPCDHGMYLGNCYECERCEHGPRRKVCPVCLRAELESTRAAATEAARALAYIADNGDNHCRECGPPGPIYRRAREALAALKDAGVTP